MINSDQYTCTTSAVRFTTLPGGSALTRGTASVVITLLTGSATVYVGGSGVSATNGYKLQNGTLPTAGVIAPLATVTINGSGDVFAIGASGSEVLSYVVSWTDA